MKTGRLLTDALALLETVANSPTASLEELTRLTILIKTLQADYIRELEEEIASLRRAG